MNKFATIMRESSTARFFIPAGILLIIFGIAVFVINRQTREQCGYPYGFYDPHG